MEVMMRTFLFFFAFASAGLAHAGIFGVDTDGMAKNCLTKHSRAWCAADAAKFARGFNDYKRADAFPGQEKSGVSTVLDIGMLGATTAGWVPSTPGMSNGVSAGLLALTLLTDTQAKLLSGDRVFGWMPIEEASSADEALKLFYKRIDEAVTMSFAGYSLGEDVLFNPERAKYLPLHKRDIAGGACGESAKCHLLYLDGATKFSKPTEGMAPEWAGGYKAWVFDGSKGGHDWVNLVVNNVAKNYTFAAELSKHLPDWMWLTVSPDAKFFGTPRNPGLKVPLVFNRGEMLAPIFPEVQITPVAFRLEDLL